MANHHIPSPLTTDPTTLTVKFVYEDDEKIQLTTKKSTFLSTDLENAASLFTDQQKILFSVILPILRRGELCIYQASADPNDYNIKKIRIEKGYIGGEVELSDDLPIINILVVLSTLKFVSREALMFYVDKTSE